MSAWTNIRGIMKRELGGYFTSPIAYVFLVIFLLPAHLFQNPLRFRRRWPNP